MMRVGIGYDVHQLGPNRPLILGGVTIPHHLGLLGHSDADVLSHAITDALLGALALGSIGDWFPDTDDQYKGADSLVLLETVVTAIHKKGYVICNVDSVIMAQEPKLMPYMSQIQESLAKVLGCSINAVGVKATTTETLGFVGKKEGMAAQAVALLVNDSNS
jgi:2-C-methyl-D-erythritol 2,4-cyclodiphosphate synthase